MRNVKVPNSGFWFVPWIWSWGGQLVGGDGDPALDSQGFRDALSFYQRLAENGHSPLGIDAPTSRIIFANGRAGFVFDGPWLRGMLPTMTDNPNIHDMYKVFMVPNGVNGEPWTIANPTSLVVLKDSPNKELAFRYVKYLTESPEVSELFVNQMGLLPTYMPFVESSEDLQSEFAQTFFSQMEYSRGVPWKDPRWPGLQEILSSAVSDAISGRDVDQIATDAQSDFVDLLEQ
jgi:ABC-type glycerol-3-phosphate transport system substrate-binding protein